MERSGLVRHAGDDGGRLEPGWFPQMVCDGSGGSVERLFGDDNRDCAHSGLLRRPLHVREPYRAHHGTTARASDGSHRSAGNASQVDLATLLLHDRLAWPDSRWERSSSATRAPFLFDVHMSLRSFAESCPTANLRSLAFLNTAPCHFCEKLI